MGASDVRQKRCLAGQSSRMRLYGVKGIVVSHAKKKGLLILDILTQEETRVKRETHFVDG